MISLDAPILESPFCWVAKSEQLLIGVNMNGGWFIKTPNEILRCDSVERCTPLLPILELERDFFEEFINRSAPIISDYASAIRSFPLEELLICALTTAVSDYWPEKALAWIKIEQKLNASLLRAVEELSINKNYSQRIRQKAAQMVHRHVRRFGG